MKRLVNSLKLIRSAGLTLRTSAPMSMAKPINPIHPWQGASLTHGLKSWMSTHAFHHKNTIKSSYEGSGFYV